MTNDRGISFSTTTTDGKEYVSVFEDPNSTIPTHTYIIDNMKKEIHMSDKTALLTAIEQNKLSELVPNESKDYEYKLEVTSIGSNLFRVTQTTKYGWHYNDEIVAEGTIEHCAQIVNEKYNHKIL